MNALALTTQEAEWDFQFHDKVVLESSPSIPDGLTLRLHRTPYSDEGERNEYPIASYVGQVDEMQVVIGLSPLSHSTTASGNLVVHRPCEDVKELRAIGADPDKLTPDRVLQSECVKDNLPSHIYDLPGMFATTYASASDPTKHMADQVRDAVADLATMQMDALKYGRHLRESYLEQNRRAPVKRDRGHGR